MGEVVFGQTLRDMYIKKMGIDKRKGGKREGEWKKTRKKILKVEAVQAKT